ncbi:MAG: recombinase RecT [Vagococcus salmoninarum]|uniref:recombinase RecT n=1 Tax=Vagococcus salmoninarum TaxID=2739 RepID=UPI003F9C6E39
MTNNQAPAVMQKDITDQVTTKVAAMQKEGLALPQSYSAANALKSAFFTMTNAAGGNLLEKCSKESIANALLDMTIQGLSPAKTQCYFVPYGSTLKMSRSYFGTMAVVKRLNGVKDIWANIIFEGDKFEIDIDDKGREKLINHQTSFLNRDNPIIGAYAIVESDTGEQFLTTMTKKEIDASWSQAKTKNVQNKFPQEMAKRTVINRAAKAFINTSDDSDLLIESINKTTENEYDNDRKDVTPEADIQSEIDEKANTEVFEAAQTPARKHAEPTNVDSETGEIIENEQKQEALFENLADVQPEPTEDGDPY